MKKKVVVLGGGNGLSSMLKGLKLFPLDITAVVSVSDDGKSTGKLREEFNIPAVGDIRRVIVALSETEPLVQKLMNYRFDSSCSLSGHTLGNLLLTGLIDVSGDISKAIASLSNVLNLSGTVLPLTSDNVTLEAVMFDGTHVEGEHNITEYPSNIKKISYKKEPTILPQVIKEIENADLIVFSMGSLFTSIICNLICKEVITAIDASNAKLLYVCNMMTQPGETEDYTVSDHINVLNSYLGQKKIDACIINNGEISDEIINKYKVLEQKDPVVFDKENVNIKVIEDDFIAIEDGVIKHNFMKLGFQIFAYTVE